MSNMNIKKLAGYCLILGPILALVCFFIQPGGVLGIGGSAEPLDFAGQIQIAVDNSMLGILTAMLIPVGLISLFSGIFYYVRSMEGGNGHAISSLSTPFFLSAIIGWSIANGIWVGIASEIIKNAEIIGITYGINIVSSMSFGFGGIFLALGASTRNEVKQIITYIAAIAAAAVMITSFLLAFSPDSGNTIAQLNGLCFMIYTLWSIMLGRSLATK